MSVNLSATRRRGFVAPPPSGPTALSTAAAALAAGQWATFTCNYPSTLTSLIFAGGVKYIVEYADKMVWDSVRQQIYFTGGGHSEDEKTIVYHDVTNTWEDLGTPPWYTQLPGNAIHGYQHNTYANGVQYYGIFASRTIRTRDVENDTWSTIDTSGINQFSGLTGAVEWFPTYGAGSLMIVQGGGVDDGPGTVLRRSGGSWTEIGTPNMGAYHNIGVYSSILDLVFFGGGNGSKKTYILTNAGTITAKTDCPSIFGITTAVSTWDPVSGKLLVFDGGAQVLRLFDHVGNSWSTDATAPPAGFWNTSSLYGALPAFGIIACPIPDYGVTLFISISNGTPQVYLRKGRA